MKLDFYNRKELAINLIARMYKENKDTKDITRTVLLTYGFSEKFTLNIIELLKE